MKKRRKVIYLITKNTQGRGGHYYSMKTTMNALKETIDPVAITVSKVKSSLKKKSFKETDYTIYCNGWNLLYVIYILIKYIRKERPVVIHAFDGPALFFARIISHTCKIPILYTKCGGANPNGYYPYAKEIILYSRENLNFFKSQEKLNNSTFYYIPNRVTSINSDADRIEIIKKKIHDTKKVLLRIARFGPAYQKSIMQSIDLVEFLNMQQIEIQLVIIGIVQDKQVYDEVMSYISKRKYLDIYVFVDDIITANASELIDCADYVVGTGRSFMEAASKYKILFTPIGDSELPMLVTKENFESLFITNFSPRNQCSTKEIQQNKKNIIRLFESKGYLEEQKKFVKSIYEEYFNINTTKEEYKKIYSSVVYQKEENLLDFLEHFVRTSISFAK